MSNLPMNQITFTDMEYYNRKKKAKHEGFR